MQNICNLPKISASDRAQSPAQDTLKAQQHTRACPCTNWDAFSLRDLAITKTTGLHLAAEQRTDKGHPRDALFLLGLGPVEDALNDRKIVLLGTRTAPFSRHPPQCPSDREFCSISCLLMMHSHTQRTSSIGLS